MVKKRAKDKQRRRAKIRENGLGKNMIVCFRVRVVSDLSEIEGEDRGVVENAWQACRRRDRREREE